MCLDKVDKKTKKDVRYAYKIFREIGHRKYYPIAYIGTLWKALRFISLGLYLFLYTTFVKCYRKGEVYTSSKRGIRAFDNTKYRSGFHCYVNKVDAFRQRDMYYSTRPVLKVRVEDIVASGDQDGDVVVARRMELIEECQPDT